MSLEISIRKMQVWKFSKQKREGKCLCHGAWRATPGFYKEINILFSDTTTSKDNVKVVKCFITAITPPKLSATRFLLTWKDELQSQHNLQTV